MTTFNTAWTRNPIRCRIQEGDTECIAKEGGLSGAKRDSTGTRKMRGGWSDAGINLKSETGGSGIVEKNGESGIRARMSWVSGARGDAKARSREERTRRAYGGETRWRRRDLGDVRA
jgi:hypothetical protein